MSKNRFLFLFTMPKKKSEHVYRTDNPVALTVFKEVKGMGQFCLDYRILAADLGINKMFTYNMTYGI